MSLAISTSYITAAYLVGSIPIAFLFGKSQHVDLASSGSGNLGAGNTTRLLGPKAGAVVALLDGVKGLLVVAGGRALGLPLWAVVIASLAVVAGTDWSIYLGRRSGRGLATSAIVMLVFDPVTILWPGIWSIAGWKIGGGITGFFGWAFLWAAALAIHRSPATVALAAGLGFLMIVRRAQGNLDDPSQPDVLSRILYDTDRRQPVTETASGGEQTI